MLDAMLRRDGGPTGLRALAGATGCGAERAEATARASGAVRPRRIVDRLRRAPAAASAGPAAAVTGCRRAVCARQRARACGSGRAARVRAAGRVAWTAAGDGRG